MALIYLSRDFADGYIQFPLPGLRDGLLKILVSARASDNHEQEFRLDFNGAGARYAYKGGVVPANQVPPVGPPIEDTSILLATCLGQGQQASVFSSEILVCMNPADDFIWSQARSSSFALAGDSATFDIQNWVVSGARSGMETLNSVGLRIARNSGPSVGVSGWARLFYYPHLVDLQAEIGP